VVTSPTGAAIADFLETFLARWRACDLIVVPSRVQGAGAAEELAAALAVAGRLTPAVDVIALVRGRPGHRLTGSEKLRIDVPLATTGERVELLRKTLQALQ
jgi:hypothetical protein